MSAGWVNLIVLAAMLAIVAVMIAIFYFTATRKGGRRKTGLAKPPKDRYQRPNPKTGDMFR